MKSLEKLREVLESESHTPLEEASRIGRGDSVASLVSSAYRSFAEEVVKNLPKAAKTGTYLPAATSMVGGSYGFLVRGFSRGDIGMKIDFSVSLENDLNTRVEILVYRDDLGKAPTKTEIKIPFKEPLMKAAKKIAKDLGTY